MKPKFQELYDKFLDDLRAVEADQADYVEALDEISADLQSEIESFESDDDEDEDLEEDEEDEK